MDVATNRKNNKDSIYLKSSLIFSGKTIIRMRMNREKNISKESIVKERRVFLKKALYSAPTLLTLGSMTKVSANPAGSEIVPPPPSSSLAGSETVPQPPSSGWN